MKMHFEKSSICGAINTSVLAWTLSYICHGLKQRGVFCFLCANLRIKFPYVHLLRPLESSRSATPASLHNTHMYEQGIETLWDGTGRRELYLKVTLGTVVGYLSSPDVW